MGWLNSAAPRRVSRQTWLIMCIAPLLIGGAVLLAQGQSTASGTTPPAAPATTAQGNPQPATAPISSQGIDPATGELPTIKELFFYSPYINGIILGLSVLALMIFLFFLLTINARAMVPADFVDEVTKLVVRRKYEAAGDLCRAHRRVFVASIIQRCAENAGKGHSVIMDMIESEGRRRADIVWNRISYLADIANVAPMLGLLGTVIGMIHAFFAAQESASMDASAGALTQGIAQAMSTTMFGLLCGISALVLYSFTKARATRVLAEVEAAVHSVADHIKREETVEWTEEQ